MVAGRVIVGMGFGALAAAVLAVAPAFGAQDDLAYHADKRPVTLSTRGGIGSFTPAAADPRLAAVLTRAGLNATGFRFTPAESRRTGGRAITVAVRARSSRTTEDAQRVASAAPWVSLTPLAYNLGVSVGWKRFAVFSDTAHVDLAGAPGSRESVDVGIGYTGRRVSGQLKAGADRPLANAPKLVTDMPSYSIDLGGAYSLTRNLDVTAGVRYKSERDRLQRLQDDRLDSQAVYIGTAFRF